MTKYYITIEPLYTQGTGGYIMTSSSKESIEMLRFELLKLIKRVEYTDGCGVGLYGWEFYENIYRIIDVKHLNDDNSNTDCEYILAPIHSREYIPDNRKINNFKKINWNKRIAKKDYVKIDTQFMEEDLVYNYISENYDIININNFNILGDVKKH